MLPSLVPTQIMIIILLLAWLGACMLHDLRSRQVPAMLTIPPLFLAAFWRLFQGGWQMVLLVCALILISDLPWAKWRIPLACMLSILALSIAGSPGSVYAIQVIFAAWAMWEIGATGGADAKILLTLALLFASGQFFIPVVLVSGIQGVFGLIFRRKTIPYTVAITLGTTAWLWLSARG